MPPPMPATPAPALIRWIHRQSDSATTSRSPARTLALPAPACRCARRHRPTRRHRRADQDRRQTRDFEHLVAPPRRSARHSVAAVFWLIWALSPIKAVVSGRLDRHRAGDAGIEPAAEAGADRQRFRVAARTATPWMVLRETGRKSSHPHRGDERPFAALASTMAWSRWSPASARSTASTAPAPPPVQDRCRPPPIA